MLYRGLGVCTLLHHLVTRVQEVGARRILETRPLVLVPSKGNRGKTQSNFELLWAATPC